MAKLLTRYLRQYLLSKYFQITNQNLSESPPSTKKKDSNNISIGNATSQDVNKSIQRLRQELDALEDLIQKLNKEQKGD